MNRKNFKKMFDKHFERTIESNIFHFDILTKSATDELELNENLCNFFIEFLEKLKINDKFSILSNLNIEKNFNYDYDEEFPESDFCEFNCKININELFDKIKETNKNSKNYIYIYRIEGPENRGLYDGFFASKKVEEVHPSPKNDSNFQGIFDNQSNDYNYQKKWFFAFNSINDLKSWIINEENEKELEKKGFFVKKIKIDSDFVILGDRQLIYKKEKVENIETLKWNELIKENQNKLKNNKRNVKKTL